MPASSPPLSFGYLVTADFKREDGVRELLGIDLFEVSLTPAPANPDTRIVSMKSESKRSDELDRWFYEVFGGKNTQQKRHRVTPEMEAEIREIAAKAEAKEAKAARKARPIKVARFEV